MSFNIILQTNTSEKNRMDKEITDIVTLSGNLRDRTSLSDVTVMIEATAAQVANCNYVTISEFHRSYFVKDITSIRTGLYQLSCHCDVLSTYKEQIRACTGIIHKQETQYNLYLNDGTFRVFQNPLIQIRQFPYGFSDLNFILAVAGA